MSRLTKIIHYCKEKRTVNSLLNFVLGELYVPGIDSEKNPLSLCAAIGTSIELSGNSCWSIVVNRITMITAIYLG